jgi:hypothetical protein
MMSLPRMISVLVVLLVLPAAAAAQTIGTFAWQFQPFCNVVTVTVSQQGAAYNLDGFDDQCGAAQRASVVGNGHLNPDGTIGFGFHIVQAPTAAKVTVEARINLGTLSGTWSDSDGNQGTLAFNQATGGSARPLATGARVYAFGARNLTSTTEVGLTVPVTADVLARSIWIVQADTASFTYSLPGAGPGGTTTYRVYWSHSGSTATFYLNRASGTGDSFTNVRVIRVVP